MRKLRVLDTFSGIGGFSKGLEDAGGFETVAFCEIDGWCRSILAKLWPGVPIFEDIRTLTSDQIGPIDVICGGFPCQPFSTAGKRRGTEDDRHLWPEMLRLIDELKPTWVIGENVAGIRSMVKSCGEPKVESRLGGGFADGIDYTSVSVQQENMLLNDICEDLDKIGYEIIPFNIPACAVDAPHKRERIWIVAYNDRGQFARECSNERESNAKSDGRNDIGGICENVANTAGEGFSDGRRAPMGKPRQKPKLERCSGVDRGLQDVANAKDAGIVGREWKPGNGESTSCGGGIGPSGSGINVGREDVSDTNCDNAQGFIAGGVDQKKRQGPNKRQAGPLFASERRLWPTEPGVGRVAYGVPHRVDRLKGLGNAVVPEKVERLARAIMAVYQQLGITI